MSRQWVLGAVCAALLLGGGYWLWSSGYTNVLGYAMILICPLMHLFMHRGHGHGHGGESGAAHGDKGNTKASCH